MSKVKTITLVTILLLFSGAFFTYHYVFKVSAPNVNTVTVKAEDNSAILQGMITDDGSKEVRQYGFKWGTSQDLKQMKTFRNSIKSNQEFTATIKNLKPGTYYYQAYAINAKGPGYGTIKRFTIQDKYHQAPTVLISNPEDQASFPAGSRVTIAVVAEDVAKVETISLYINDSLIVKKNGTALEYTLDTSSLPPGEYKIKVVAWNGIKKGEQLIRIKITAAENFSSSDHSQYDFADRNPNGTSVSRSNSTNKYKYPKVSKWNGSYGQFRYRELSGGRIEVDPQWVAENIVTIKLPGINQYVQVHRRAADNFIQAFTYIQNGSATINGRKVPLRNLIRTMDGTYVTRHVNWNPSRGLSNHSWGTAIDINAANHFRYVNPSKEPYNPNLILWEKAFKPAGFSWGNRYGDAMHFEMLD